MSSRKEKKRANLRDVAAAAGVSVATVSRVLNSPNKVNEDTRERVQHSIDKLNFVPSAAARAINSGRSRVVGALVTTLDNAIFARTLDALENRLSDFGLSLIVATTEDDPEKETKKTRELLNIGVEGLIITGVTHSPEMDALINRWGIPAVAISYFDPDYYLPTIAYDNRAAAAVALNHLADLSYNNIAVIHGPLASDRTRDRISCLKTAPSDISFKLFETEISISGGSKAVHEALNLNHGFDAFLCLSDVLATGVLFELQRRSLTIPNDVAVMGLDDLPSSLVTCPRLSTVRLPSQEMGLKAAEALGNWVEHDVRPDPLCLPTDLIVRESTQKQKS